MRAVSVIVVFSILLGCMGHQERNYNMKINALDFLESKKYTYSEKKSDIPNVVVDSIGSINNESFKIGDSADIGKISFSDASLGGYEFKRKLHFTLVSDTFCLISYTEGGIGTHEVIDFVQYKGEFRSMQYVTNSILSDTIKLKNYLKSEPNPVKTELTKY